MTVLELFEALKDAPLDSTVHIRVDCPNGGNSLPIEVNNVFTDKGQGTWLVMRPLDGYEFDVEDMLEEEDDEYPDFGKCKRCGEWVHFPCCNCIARDLEEGKV